MGGNRVFGRKKHILGCFDLNWNLECSSRPVILPQSMRTMRGVYFNCFYCSRHSARGQGGSQYAMIYRLSGTYMLIWSTNSMCKCNSFSLRLAQCEARRGLASLFPGVEDTRRPARMSIFWEESAPSWQPNGLTGPSFEPSIFINSICH